MNNQEAFDKMVTHLFTQKSAAKNEEGSCYYRMVGGKMCAVGALIPDEQYSEDLENNSAEGIHDRVPALKDVSVGLLQNMQDIHDNCSVDEWYRYAIDVAQSNMLNTNVLETFKDVGMSISQ